MSERNEALTEILARELKTTNRLATALELLAEVGRGVSAPDEDGKTYVRLVSSSPSDWLARRDALLKGAGE